MKHTAVKRNKNSILTEEHFKDKNVKVRISMFIPLDVQNAFRDEAKELGIGYQTLMQMHLRLAMAGRLNQELSTREKSRNKAG